MKRILRLILVLAVLAAAGVAAWLLYTHFGRGSASAQPKPLVASGFIEADTVSVTTDLGGRITVLRAAEGDDVQSGQILVELDNSLLLAQLQGAQADVAVAEANLAQARAGAGQPALDYAQAVVHQAQVAREAARVGAEDAQAMLANPQDLNLAIVAARAQLGVLDFQEKQAKAMADSGQTVRDLADQTVSLLEGIKPHQEWVLVAQFDLNNLPSWLPLPPSLPDGEYFVANYKVVVHGGTVDVYARVTIEVPPVVLKSALQQQADATYQSWAAWTGVDQAKAAQAAAQGQLQQLEQQKANPLTLKAQADSAQSEYEIATAAVGQAQAQLDGLKMGATPEQIAALQAQVEVSRAAQKALEARLGKLTLTAPISGLVLEQPAHAGEVAVPGAPLLTLADLDRLTLTVYVPENQIGRVQVGQPVSITVDAYPGRSFPGTVSLIGASPEFTPKNVQTQQERVSMVFAVDVRVSNPDHALKPGMPADATFAQQQGPGSHALAGNGWRRLCAACAKDGI